MFKSKLNFKVFDKRDRSTTHLTTVTVKNRARACCGRLSNRLGQTTPFHLILNYFDDQPGEPKGHFIDFGIHTKLQKHFEKVETKAGGQEKRFSESLKEAASGIAFVEKKDGQELLYLVPLRSKIPATGWSKFLKKSKALFGNRPGVILSEQEWAAWQTAVEPEEEPDFETALGQLQTTLETFQNQGGSLSKAQLAAPKATLQALLKQYRADNSLAPREAVQTVVDLWKALRGRLG